MAKRVRAERNLSPSVLGRGNDLSLLRRAVRSRGGAEASFAGRGGVGILGSGMSRMGGRGRGLRGCGAKITRGGVGDLGSAGDSIRGELTGDTASSGVGVPERSFDPAGLGVPDSGEGETTDAGSGGVSMQ